MCNDRGKQALLIFYSHNSDPFPLRFNLKGPNTFGEHFSTLFLLKLYSPYIAVKLWGFDVCDLYVSTVC